MKLSTFLFALAGSVLVEANGASSIAAAATSAQSQQAAVASSQAGSFAAQVLAGQGTTGNGDACACDCLCGAAAVPSNVGLNNFGGYAGMLPSSVAMASTGSS